MADSMERKMKVICECGCNFKDMTEAKEMIRQCHKINANLVKFQLFSKEYAEKNGIDRHLSLTFDQAKELFDYGKSIGQKVFFTPFDVERVDWCYDLGVKQVKVRCADRFNKELLTRIYTIFGKDVDLYISIMNDVEDYVEELRDKDIPIYLPFHMLYCVPFYPANIEDYLCDQSEFILAYSDHTPDLKLMKIMKILDPKNSPYIRIEKHVKLREDCLESKWSVFIHELGEVING